jgi:hypothetical protein
MKSTLLLLVIVALGVSACAVTQVVEEEPNGLECLGAGTVTEAAKPAADFSGFPTPEGAVLETTFGRAQGVLTAEGTTWVLRIEGRPVARFEVTRLEDGGFVVASSSGCADLFEELTGG